MIWLRCRWKWCKTDKKNANHYKFVNTQFILSRVRKRLNVTCILEQWGLKRVCVPTLHHILHCPPTVNPFLHVHTFKISSQKHQQLVKMKYCSWIKVTTLWEITQYEPCLQQSTAAKTSKCVCTWKNVKWVITQLMKEHNSKCYPFTPACDVKETHFYLTRFILYLGKAYRAPVHCRR